MISTNRPSHSAIDVSDWGLITLLNQKKYEKETCLRKNGSRTIGAKKNSTPNPNPVPNPNPNPNQRAGGAIFFKGNCLDTRKNIFKDTLKAFGHYGNKQKSMYILEVYLIHYTSGQNTYVKKMSFEQNK